MVQIGVNLVVAASGASDQGVCGVSKDASLHADSNDTIGGRVQHRRPEKSPFWFGIV